MKVFKMKSKMGRIFHDRNEIFDTPTLRYYELKRKFQEHYLNPQAWNNGYGTREYIETYHDMLVYMEKTEEFREEDPDLKNEIPVDNEHLVLRYLPLPVEIKEELNDFVNPRKVKREEKLSRIKMFFEKKVKSGMAVLEFNEMPDPRYVKIKENKMKITYDDKKETVQRKVDARKNAEYKYKIKARDELLDIRQTIYSKIKRGLYVDSIMRAFKFKVEDYLKKYRKSLSYHQEKIWRDKIVITEKAVNKSRREFETRLKARTKEEVEVNPVIEEVSDAARAYEAAAENLPEPPDHDIDEIEVRLLELKKFNDKMLDKDTHPRKKVKVAEAECEVGVIGVHEIVKKKVTKQRIKAAKLYVEDVDDSMNIGDENVVEVKNDKNHVRKNEVEEKETKVINENDDKIEVLDVEECMENHVNMKFIENENMKDELENVDAVESKENKSKVVDKSHDKINEMSDDKIDVKNEFIENPEHVKELSQGEDKGIEIIEENLDKLDLKNDDSCVKLNDDDHDETVDPDNGSNTEEKEVMHEQRLGGHGYYYDVVKGKDTLTIIPLLQANLAVMLLCVKTIQEQSELLTQLSDLSRSSSMSTPSQPTASFPRAHSSCLTQSRMCSRIPRPTWPSQGAGR